MHFLVPSWCKGTVTRAPYTGVKLYIFTGNGLIHRQGLIRVSEMEGGIQYGLFDGVGITRTIDFPRNT